MIFTVFFLFSNRGLDEVCKKSLLKWNQKETFCAKRKTASPKENKNRLGSTKILLLFCGLFPFFEAFFVQSYKFGKNW